MDEPIPLSVPTLCGRELAYLKECIDTNWVSYVGPFVDRFERDLAQACGARFAIATVSGTAALHIALLLGGVEPESEVIMPALTFVAPANACRYCFAWPALIDLSPDDWQLDISRLSEFLEKACVLRKGGLYNKQTKRRISALLPVHLLGDVCDVDAVAALAAKYDLFLVEDAAEAMGSRYRGRPIGAETSNIDNARRIVTTSFNGNKIVTTGGGGALLLNDAALAARARHLVTTAKTNSLEFFHDEVGYNYRMTNLAAAVGVAQLEQLEAFAAKKRATADRYRHALESRTDVTVHPTSQHGTPIFWLYTIRTPRPALPIVKRLNDRSVTTRPLWTPLAQLPMFRDQCSSTDWPNARALHSTAISLPSSVSLTPAEQQRVITILCEELDSR